MVQTVPVQKLTLAPENPRSTGIAQVTGQAGIAFGDPLGGLAALHCKEAPPEALAELTESIRQQGVLQNLLAYADEEGLFVVGGGRRLRALERLLAEGAIPPEYPVPVRVLPKEAALEAALVENLQREDMSPAEEIEAVARLVELVAGRFGLGALERPLSQGEREWLLGQDLLAEAPELRFRE